MIYEQARKGYANLWQQARLKPEKRLIAQAIANKLLANKTRYAQAAANVGCPWWWVAIVHNLESNGDFRTHLHNGDPLNARTTHVPPGRPREGNPPFTWEFSAADALRLKKLNEVPSWEVSRCLFEFERYNGFGYVSKGVNSPYLWSFTTLYERGKYVSDGAYDASAVSSQCGAAAILQAFIELGAVSFTTEDAMTELANTLKPFEQLVPTLVRAIAGPLPSLAVRALAEALGVAAVTDDVKQKLEDVPLADLIGALQKAETTVSAILPASPLQAAPAIAASSSENLTTGTQNVTATASQTTGGQQNVNTGAPGTMTVQPVRPEPSKLEVATGGWLTGWKTNAGIVVYVVAHVAGSLGYIDQTTADAIAVSGAGLAGVGVISKVERWLPLFAGFLRVKKLLS